MVSRSDAERARDAAGLLEELLLLERRYRPRVNAARAMLPFLGDMIARAQMIVDEQQAHDDDARLKKAGLL